MRTFLNILLISITVMTGSAGCKKEDDFLAAKPNERLATLNTLSDCAALLADEDIMNRWLPGLGEVSADDYYLPTERFNLLYDVEERNALTWGGMPFYNPDYSPYDWFGGYQIVYYTNTLLEALPGIPVEDGQKTQADAVRGGALFFRSLAFYELLETFSLPYDSLKAGSQPGILLRLATDINKGYPRATQQACYDQVIGDLQTAAELLPEHADLITHASKAAAYGLLSRVYLSTGNFPAARDAAGKALSINSALTDYNTLPNADYKLTSSNDYLAEDIFHMAMNGYSSMYNTDAIVDSTLFRSYEDNDLRKTLFFFNDGETRFKGYYEVKMYDIFYSGVATDELYLTRAECEARAGDAGSAMTDLNALLVNRYITGTFIPHTAVDKEEALRQILLERRKELIFRGIRWKDLRRLNREPGHATTLTRIVNNTTYTLPPGDRRYALPIPDREIALSHIEQNPR